jgi:hypothetical protein
MTYCALTIDADWALSDHVLISSQCTVLVLTVLELEARASPGISKKNGFAPTMQRHTVVIVWQSLIEA